MSANLPVLAYHSIAPGERIGPELLETHFAVLARSGLPSLLPAGLATAPRGFLLTFDDGFADLWTHALALLETHDLRAVVFAIPRRAGEGAQRPRGVVAHPGTAADADREAATGGGPHPGFLRWSELEALEASGRVVVQSHSYSHRMGWVDDQLLGFNLGRFGRRFWYAVEASGGDARLGVPVFQRGSALAHRLFREDPELREELTAWVDSRGGDAWIAQAGLRTVEEGLREIVQAYRARRGRLGLWETDEERRARTIEEIARARQELERRLGGRRDELCLPWGESDALTLACARQAGIRRVYTLIRGANPAGRVGFLVNRFEPRPQGALWLRNRLWIHRSARRARWYGLLSRTDCRLWRWGPAPNR